MILQEIEPKLYEPPEDTLRKVYILRVLRRFAGFFGLADIEQISKDPINREYRVRATDMLNEVVEWKLWYFNCSDWDIWTPTAVKLNIDILIFGNKSVPFSLFSFRRVTADLAVAGAAAFPAADLIEQRRHLKSLNPELFVHYLEHFGRV